MYSLLSIYVCYLIRRMEIIVSDFKTVIPTNPILATLTDASIHLKIPHSKVMVPMISAKIQNSTQESFEP